LRECYRFLYRSNLNVKQACAQIAAEIASSDVRDHLLAFIEHSQRGIVR
jgi:acyl-[acyl carrier protein]--UDP-N-acetylglucosamine O-acyltransferase